MEKEMKKFCLFDGRHELPSNEGALFSSFDFQKFVPVQTEKYEQAMDLLKKGEQVGLYVTGLTPALTFFLSKVKNLEGELFLLHYNSQTREYVEQLF